MVIFSEISHETASQYFKKELQIINDVDSENEDDNQHSIILRKEINVIIQSSFDKNIFFCLCI
jgi:hypothetical protein